MGGLIRGGLGLITLFDIFCIESSLSKVLFSIILKVQSNFKH